MRSGDIHVPGSFTETSRIDGNGAALCGSAFAVAAACVFRMACFVAAAVELRADTHPLQQREFVYRIGL